MRRRTFSAVIFYFGGNMKQGVVIVNAYSDSETELNQSVRLQEEFSRMGVKLAILRNNRFAVRLNERGGIVNELSAYDFCVYLDKDKYVSALLEGAGMRLFNCAKAIADCDDKMQTFLALAGAEIPMPATLSGFLCYTPQKAVLPEALDRVERLIGYPVVVKECYGSLGKWVYKADDRKQLIDLAERLKCKPHLFQRFVAESAGKDLRVIAVGGKPIAAMKRTSESDFRSNIELGGRGESYPITEEITRLTERVCARLRLDYCGIDYLFGKEGLLVCEVNSNAFFGGIEKITGVNAAKAYARHIYKSVYKEKV